MVNLLDNTNYFRDLFDHQSPTCTQHIQNYLSQERFTCIILEIPSSKKTIQSHEKPETFYNYYTQLLAHRLRPILQAAFQGKNETIITLSNANFYKEYSTSGNWTSLKQDPKLDIAITKKVLEELKISFRENSAVLHFQNDIDVTFEDLHLTCHWKINNLFAYPELTTKKCPKPSSKHLQANELRKKIGDFTIKLSNGHEFRSDKITLALHSKFFKSLFEQTFKDSQERSVLLDFGFNLEDATVESFLDYLFTNYIDLSQKAFSLEMIIELGLLADATVTNDLKKLCSHELMLRMEEKSFWAIVLYAHTVKSIPLIERSVLFIEQNEQWIENSIALADKDITHLLQILHVGTHIENDYIIEKVLKEIEKKISLSTFVEIYEEAKSCEKLKLVCLNFVDNSPDFATNASNEALAAYIKLLSNGKLDITKRLKN